MSISIKYTNGVFAPMVFCDYCDGRIDNPRHGVAIWEMVEEEEIQVCYAHKGRCHDEIEGILKPKFVGWSELTRHLTWLLSNSGVTLKMQKEIKETDY